MTLKAIILDAYGQQLGKDTTVVFPVTAPTAASLQLTQSQNMYSTVNMITLDPAVLPVFYITTRNTRSVQVRAYVVNPIHHFESFSEYIKTPTRESPDFGHQVWKATVKVVPPRGGAGADEEELWHQEAMTMIDLSKAFGCDDSMLCGRSKESQLVVAVIAQDVVDPSQPPPGVQKLWMTWTDIGIAYAADSESIYAYVI